MGSPGQFSGACLCGAIRYSVDGPVLGEAVCHCRHCQRQSGSAFSVLAVVKRKTVAFVGESTCFVDQGDSGRAVHRHFCGRCGSPLYTELPHMPGLLFLKAGTLDDPTWLTPRQHVWCASAWPWTPIPADAIRSEGEAT